MVEQTDVEVGRPHPTNSPDLTGGRGVLNKWGSACVGFLRGPLLVALLILACGSAWSVWRFGSVRHGIAYLKGYVLIAQNPTVKLGSIPAGTEVEGVFVLKNLTNRPITVLGAKPECTCVMTSDLPMRVDSLSTGRLRFKFAARNNEINQSVAHRTLLYLDVDSPPVVLTLAGDVVSPGKAQQSDAAAVSRYSPSGKHGSARLDVFRASQ